MTLARLSAYDLFSKQDLVKSVSDYMLHETGRY